MATDLGKTKSARPAAGAKHDAFVKSQLERAAQRVWMLDAAAALLGYAALVCGFLVTAALADRAWPLPDWVRQILLAGFVVGSGVYLYFTLGRPLRYRVNPYYAAQMVEHSLPDAKNSVVNWLDLQQQPLAPAIRAAVGQKAAKDLSKTDLERAFSTRRVAWTGALSAVCAVALLACFVALGGDAFFHLKRIFTPFSFGSATSRTTITLVRPVQGDDLIVIGHAVFIAAQIEGKLPDPQGPDAARVLVRYQENEPYLTHPLRQDGGEFTCTISAVDVHDGFWYKVVAGDAETPEYRISVRSTPQLTDVEATYHFRPYTGWIDELHYGKRAFPLKALRGTEITLAVRTNREIKEAALVLDGKDGPERFRAEQNAADPQAFSVKLTVDQSTRYHLEFATPEGENYNDPNPQAVEALPDLPPQPVDLTAPGRDTQLPCNGVLSVEGAATDDVGVKSLTLRLREVTQRFELQGKPYRSEKELRLPSGGYAQKLVYKDFVDLKTVQLPNGNLLALQPDMELEYWLEASDACDMPQPQVTASKHYRVKLLPPEKDPEQQQNQRAQAKQEQQQHQKKQDDALRSEDAKRLEDEQRRNEDARQEKKAEQSSAKPGGKKDENKGADQQNQDKETGDLAKKLKEELDRNNKKNEQKSASKPGPQEAPAKAKSDEGAGEKKPQPGQTKPEGKPEDHKEAGANKPAGDQPDPKNAPAEAKQDGKADPAQKASENKPATSPPNSPPKSEPKDNPAAKPQPRAQAKKPPSPQAKQESAQNKPEGEPNSQECPRADCKSGGVTNNPDSKNAQPKPTPAPTPTASAGKNDGGQHKGNEAKAQPKPGGEPSNAAAKPAPKKQDAAPPGESKKGTRSGGGSGDKGNATAEDVAKEKQKLHSDDPQQRQEAAKQLDKIAQEAKDDKTRAQAEQALEDAGVKEPPPAQAKAPPEKQEPSGNKSEQPGENKGQEGPQAGRGTDKGNPHSEVPPATEKGTGKPNGERLNPAGVARNKKPPQGPLNGDEPPEIKNPEKRDDKASMLQLREFMKSVDKKVLKDAGVSEEEWRTFLKNYANLAIREETKAKETIAAPQNKGSMNGIGGVRVNPGAQLDPNAPQGTGRSQAPPGYRDGWKQFTRDLNATDDKK